MRAGRRAPAAAVGDGRAGDAAEAFLVALEGVVEAAEASRGDCSALARDLAAASVELAVAERAAKQVARTARNAGPASPEARAWVAAHHKPRARRLAERLKGAVRRCAGDERVKIALDSLARPLQED